MVKQSITGPEVSSASSRNEDGKQVWQGKKELKPVSRKWNLSGSCLYSCWCVVASKALIAKMLVPCRRAGAFAIENCTGTWPTIQGS